MADKTVVLVGTLDTKGREYAFLRDRLQAAGVAHDPRRRRASWAPRWSSPT